MQDATEHKNYIFSKFERQGSAIAHGSGLVIGLPLILLLGFIVGLQPAFAYIPSVIISYMIARSFRRRRRAWGAFQGMQAAVVHLGIVLLALSAHLLGPASRPSQFLFMAATLIFFYSLWGAWDTLLGHDFRYIGINGLLHRVSQSNLKRQERKRGLFRPYRTGNDDLPGQKPPV
ncbi:MAG: hypothetical protein O2909_02485 [Chloroflexi bacterium]|nr:hypothetical protein [Chloroflexota bacterium]MDA1218293.1 hypothetical protein [Chloroflexota bacterium]PKB56939.1 MAG: hypothetical protein BZY73_05825 [SAR202 cluster bacterium Casp-Chloro-G3]